MSKFGIDVSKWQGDFDFSKAVKEDKIEFVILRGAYAKGKDTKFESYYSKCRSLNLPVGVYHYSMATTTAAAKAEAEFLYTNVLKGKKFELPIYIDVEDKVQLALSKEALTEIVKTWCEYLEKKGYFVGIYASLWTFQGELNDLELKKYTHWIAQWDRKCTYSGNIDVWQFGGEKNVLRSNQIASKTVDQNYMYRDFPTLIRNAKRNGYGTYTTIEQKPVREPNRALWKPGDKIRLKAGATYYNGQKIPSWVFKMELYVRSTEFKDGTHNISTIRSGGITGRVNKKYFVRI